MICLLRPVKYVIIFLDFTLEDMAAKHVTHHTLQLLTIVVHNYKQLLQTYVGKSSLITARGI